VLTGAAIFGLLCLLVVFGVPVVVALAAAVIVYLLVIGGWPLALPQQMILGMDDFVLLALPLFILAGGIMNAGGISGRLFDFAVALVGHLRGGLGHVNVATSLMFGGMIGTSVADLAGTGSVVMPAMKERGYPGDFTAALSASASGIGPLIPPSSPMILYSAVTGTSLGALFLAGVVPGILMGVVLMVIVAVIARRRGWQPTGRLELREVVRTGRAAILPFGMPAIILGGLVFGVFTPTEAGGFAVAYALVLSTWVYRALDLRALYRITANAAVLTGEIMLIVGLSVALGWALSLHRVPLELAMWIDRLVVTDAVTLKIMAMLVLALLAGMILDTLIPVIMPILLPTVLALEVDLVHFGVLMVVCVVIGQVTPPLAITIVVASKIADEDLARVLRANTPFLIGTVALLLLLVFVPSLATWLPNKLVP
jgi:tripartite ATP-independent transporter DctM subunit